METEVNPGQDEEGLGKVGVDRNYGVKVQRPGADSQFAEGSSMVSGILPLGSPAQQPFPLLHVVTDDMHLRDRTYFKVFAGYQKTQQIKDYKSFMHMICIRHFCDSVPPKEGRACN